MALPRGAMGFSAVCDCGISYSYTLTILGMGYPRIIPMKLCDSPPGSLGAVIKSSLLTGGRRCTLTTEYKRITKAQCGSPRTIS